MRVNDGVVGRVIELAGAMPTERIERPPVISALLCSLFELHFAESGRQGRAPVLR